MIEYKLKIDKNIGYICTDTNIIVGFIDAVQLTNIAKRGWNDKQMKIC